MQDRMTRVEMALFGWDGQSGLMGATSSDRKRLDAIEDSLKQVRVVVKAARWVILAGASAGSVLTSDHIASGLATGLQALAAAIKH